MHKLEEIRCGIIDIEDIMGAPIVTKIDSDKARKIAREEILSRKDELINLVVNNIRQAFFHQLEAKTGWGRNEIKQLFKNAIDSAT